MYADNEQTNADVDFPTSKTNLRRIEDIYTKRDNNFEQLTLPFDNVWTDGKYHKYITVDNHGSGPTGTFVKNAVTGIKYDIMVGSRDEDLLFKVTDSSGLNGRKHPLLLYYDTPEQYERHRLVTVNPRTKKVWLERSIEASKRLQLN